LLVVQGLATERSAGRAIGVSIDLEEPGEGLLVEAVGAGPAARAGIQPGDRILEVAGRPIGDEDAYDALAREFRRGQETPFVVERAGELRTFTVRPGVPFPWRQSVLGWITVAAYLAVGLFALLQQQGDLRARLLFWFALAVAVEFAAPSYVIASPLLDLVVTAGFSLLTGVQMALELHLASVIPERQPWLRRHRWVVPLYYVVGLGLGAAACLATIAEAGGAGWMPWSSAGANAILFDVGMPLWALAVPLLLALPALSHPRPQGRHQAALVLAGVLPWTAKVLLGAGHELAGLPPPAWPELIDPLVLLCYPVAIFVAVFRYQLFDMELVVRRGLVYTALTTTLLLVFYAALGAGGVLFSELLPGRHQIWAVAGATLLLGLVFTPLRRFLERSIYHRFFPERVELRRRLVALAGELPAQGKLPKMGRHLVERLCEVFDVRWATVLIADPGTGLLATLASTLGDLDDSLERSLLLAPDDPGLRLLAGSGRPFSARALGLKSPPLAQRFAQLRVDLVVPLLAQQKLVGILLLGPKEGGTKYVAEEQELLNLLAHHVAIVFENARLFESATRDSLTGLWRREAILERLELELQRAQRYGRPLSVGLADLDHFKLVNDSHGHLTGDALLRWVSHVLRGGLRSTDHVGRYGGEEFLLVLPETELAGAVTVAEKARCLVEAERLLLESGERVEVTVSIGLSGLEDFEHRPVSAKEMLAAADRSLYQAKAAGRNRVRPIVA